LLSLDINQLDKTKTLASEGILYIAFNDAFVKEMINSARSVKQYNPNIKIAVMSNDLDDSEFIDYFIKINPSHIRAKVDYIGRSPFNKTIYLDSDTIINHKIDDMFSILDKYDIAGVHDFARKRKKYSDKIPEYGNIPYGFSEINGGVLCYAKNERTQQFFDIWKNYFYKYYNMTNGWDQVSLRISLWETSASLIHLPIEFNVRGSDNREKVNLPHIREENGQEHMVARIYHMHVDRNVHTGKYDVSYEDAVKYCKERHYKF